MPRRGIDPNKVVVLSGAGLSAPSGLATFRASDGLWEQHRIEDVATPDGWHRNPELVLRFYNERRRALKAAAPNAAHIAIASLEQHFDVTVVTQNVDDLHERAGSSNVLHLHGELRKARNVDDSDEVVEIGYEPIAMGQNSPRGGQLRPHIVWFGEAVMHFEDARDQILSASRFVVVGTSLNVFPAAGLVEYAQHEAEKFLIDLDPPTVGRDFRVFRGSADIILPNLVLQWMPK